MAFLAAAAPAALGTGIGVSTTAGAALSAAMGGMGIASSALPGLVAGTAALPTAASAAGFLGTGLTFWQALSGVGTLLSTGAQIAGTVSGVRQEQQRTGELLMTNALERERLRRDSERERQSAASRRAASLAVQGGLEGNSDLIREVLQEGALDESRRASDLAFSNGVLMRRFSNVRSGGGFSAVGQLLAGGARLGSLLA